MTDNSSKNGSKHWPMVTIVMPVLNEADYIERCLQAIYAQDYPFDKLEIIVADGMSTDQTRQIIQRFVTPQCQDGISGAANIDRPTLYLIDNHKKIVSTGLNKAIQKARGEIIVRVDGHTLIESDYVRQCVEALARTGSDGVGGPMVSVGEGFIAEAIALATATKFAIGNTTYRTSRYFKERHAETTHLGAYKKDTLFAVGLFNENFVRHQDYELDYRIKQNGGAIFLCPEIRSRYFVRGSLLKLFRQYLQYGFWKGKMMRNRPQSTKLRHLVPPMFVLMIVLTMFSALTLDEIGPIAFLILMGAYLVFILLGAIFTCRGSRIKYFPVIPFVFAVVHLSWGTGVWLGVLTPEKLTPKNWAR